MPTWRENLGITRSGNTFELAGRSFPRITWYKNPALRRTYFVLFFVVLTSATNGYDGSMMNGLQTVTYWETYFNYPTGSLLGLLNAIYSVGSIAALPVVPYIPDWFGRRVGIFIGCIVMVLGVVLQTISVNFRMFIAARFFIGFGVAIAHGSSPLLIAEICHPQHRAIFTTVYNTLWYFGSIVAAWLTYGTNHINNNWAWRAPTLVQVFPSALQICFVFFVPESPRWLLAKGRDEQALKVLANTHANGDPNDELVQLELTEIRDTIRLEQEFEGNGWKELIRTKGNRHRMIIMVTAGFFSQWSGNGLVSYYINKILNQLGYTNVLTQDVINGVLQIWNLFIAVTMCFFVDKIGRRKLFLFSTAGMLCAFIVWTVCASQYVEHGSQAAAQAVLGMIFIYYFFYNCAWSGMLIGYTAEILPYKIRAKGLTIMFLAIDLARKLSITTSHAKRPSLTLVYSLLQPVHQPNCYPGAQLEVLYLLRCLARSRACCRLLLLHRNPQHSSRGNRQALRRRRCSHRWWCCHREGSSIGCRGWYAPDYRPDKGHDG